MKPLGFSTGLGSLQTLFLCSLFLYPLLVQAWRGIPFEPLLRGSLEGIAPAEARALLRGRDVLRRGALTHVVLHARLDRRYGTRRADVRGELRRAGFHKGLIEANVRGLRRLVSRLRWEPSPTQWAEYGPTTSYGEADADRKAAFVREVATARRRALVWDLGANDGHFTRIAAEHVPRVRERSCRSSPTWPIRRPRSAGAASSGALCGSGGDRSSSSASRSCITWRSRRTCRWGRSSTGSPASAASS